MQTLIVIPARHGSTRFPAKPLHQIAGHTLVARVADIARRTAETRPDVAYVIATDHDEIEAHAKEIGAPVVMTDPDLPSGTDRALAAARGFGEAPDFVLNLQGDAPFTPPAYLNALIEAAETSQTDVVTPVIQLDWAALDLVRDQKTREPFSGTSCIRTADGRALWFSKQVIPAIRKEAALRQSDPLSPVFRHIGLYGYRMDALERFASLPVGHYEQLEGLEQLRFLENGMTIQTVAVEPGDNAMWGVDTPEDASYAEALIARHGDPMEAPS
ncbi:3-deoxy-manno-octulosonate cytidylyltransferase family protein [Henriciella aquimarina]|uniref:3-deoxy-manno-octulosonate cytidylyltransferase family protein n=1 Tax=Henriciella aquimarina TaxID=545261 RepID=UPI000A0011F8|nr:manno-octulosonate cytidylyltransferase [Henriciella aquimarina]